MTFGKILHQQPFAPVCLMRGLFWRPLLEKGLICETDHPIDVAMPLIKGVKSDHSINVVFTADLTGPLLMYSY